MSKYLAIDLWQAFEDKSAHGRGFKAYDEHNLTYDEHNLTHDEHKPLVDEGNCKMTRVHVDLMRSTTYFDEQPVIF